MAQDAILEATEAELLVGPPVLCLVVGNPQLDLVVQHQVEAGTPRSGKREIREARGGWRSPVGHRGLGFCP